MTSPDRKWAYDVLHTRAMEFLLGAPRHFSIAFGHNEIAISKSGRAAPAHYEEAVKLAAEIAAGLDGIEQGLEPAEMIAGMAAAYNGVSPEATIPTVAMPNATAPISTGSSARYCTISATGWHRRTMTGFRPR